jgi:peptidoglycan/xylan/chitin deacetylase (PgdA/CDA1 family)
MQLMPTNLSAVLGAASTFMLTHQRRILPKSENGLRVLMYHKFTSHKSDYLTVKTVDFDNHLRYLTAKGFHFVTMRQVIAHYFEKKHLPPNPVLITFDDAYRSHLTEALPILQKYHACATIFVPTAHIGNDSAWESEPSPILNVEELKNLPPSVFELALHTHRHENYKSLSLEAITADIDACMAFFQSHQLSYAPVFAYAYGARPKDAGILRGMRQHFSSKGVRLAFRIGNRHNSLETPNFYEMQRIDVRGDESFGVFVRKIKWGRFL